MKIRIKFRKWGCMKFIGHLDMMRYFQKAMRRANIDICYSEGFSPHQIMSFAAPLGVGITSDGEYFDIEVHSTLTSDEAIRAINQSMVDGVEVTEYKLLPDNAKTAMSVVAAADYTMSYKAGFISPLSIEEWKKLIDEHFHTQSSFIIMKKTKKGERELDLKPFVYAFEVFEREGKPVFFVNVSTGSVNNLKPELLLESICKKAGLDFSMEAIDVHRIETYAKKDASDDFIALDEIGEIIT